MDRSDCEIRLNMLETAPKVNRIIGPRVVRQGRAGGG